MHEELLINEKASLNRPSWTSEQSTGIWHAYRHLHISRKNEPVRVDYYVKTRGLL